MKFSTRGGAILSRSTVMLQISSNRLQLLGKPPQTRSVARAGVGTAHSSPCFVQHRSITTRALSSPCTPSTPQAPEGTQVLGKGSLVERDAGTSSCLFRRYSLVPDFQKAIVGPGKQEQTVCSQKDMSTLF